MIGKPKIGIAGAGMVGGALIKYFLKAGFGRGKNLFCFDPDPKKGCSDDLKKAEIVFACVPSPSGKNGLCDTSIVEEVVSTYSKTAKAIVIKSTVPPGTTEGFAKKYKCALIFSPEFLTEAKAWENMLNPDRQIVAPTARARVEAGKILNILPSAPFTAPRHKKSLKWADINPTEAEIGKYAANTFGALKVSFANFFHDFTKAAQIVLKKEGIKTKLNYENVRYILAEDPRIGDYWLNVAHGDYRGYGGYCFPKDTEALIAYGRGILKKIPAGSDKILFQKGLKIMEAMRNYNNTLLASQGLTLENVSRHDAELLKIIKKHKKQKNG